MLENNINTSYGEHDENNNKARIQELIRKKEEAKAKANNNNNSAETDEELNKDIKKMNKKAKTENNNAMLETLGVKTNSSKRQKANVYLNTDIMDKLKTLSSLSNKSIASLIETILINNLESVEIIPDEVKKYDESNKNRKRK